MNDESRVVCCETVDVIVVGGTVDLVVVGGTDVVGGIVDAVVFGGIVVVGITVVVGGTVDRTFNSKSFIVFNPSVNCSWTTESFLSSIIPSSSW